jgi:hypothetical protein
VSDRVAQRSVRSQVSVVGRNLPFGRFRSASGDHEPTISLSVRCCELHSEHLAHTPQLARSYLKLCRFTVAANAGYWEPSGCRLYLLGVCHQQGVCLYLW